MPVTTNFFPVCVCVCVRACQLEVFQYGQNLLIPCFLSPGCITFTGRITFTQP